MNTAVVEITDHEAEEERQPMRVQYFDIKPGTSYYALAEEALDSARILIRLCREHNRALVQIEYYLAPATREQTQKRATVTTDPIWRFYPLGDNGEPNFSDLFEDIIFLTPSAYFMEIGICVVSPIVWVAPLEYHCNHIYECPGCCDCANDANLLPELGRPEKILDIFQEGKFEEYWQRRTGQAPPNREWASYERAEEAEQRGNLAEAETIYKRMVDLMQTPGERHLGCEIYEKKRFLAEFYERHGRWINAYKAFIELLKAYRVDHHQIPVLLEKLAIIRGKVVDWKAVCDENLIDDLLYEAGVLTTLERYDEAEAIYLHAKSLVRDSTSVAEILACLHTLYGKTGNLLKGQEVFELLYPNSYEVAAAAAGEIERINVEYDYEEEIKEKGELDTVTHKKEKSPRLLNHLDVKPDSKLYSVAWQALECARIMVKLCDKHDRAAVQIEYYLTPPMEGELYEESVTVTTKPMWRFYPLEDDGEPDWHVIFVDIIFSCPCDYFTDASVGYVSPMVWTTPLEYHCSVDNLIECPGCCDCVIDANELPNLGRPKESLKIFNAKKFFEYRHNRMPGPLITRNMATPVKAQEAEARGDLLQAEKIYKRMIALFDEEEGTPTADEVNERVLLLAEFYERTEQWIKAYQERASTLEDFANTPEQIASLERLAFLRRKAEPLLDGDHDRAIDLDMFLEGRLFETLQRYDEAEAAYRQILKLVEGYEYVERDVLYALNCLYDKTGNTAGMKEMSERFEPYRKMDAEEYEAEVRANEIVVGTDEDEHKEEAQGARSERVFVHRWNKLVSRVADLLTI